jgi:TolB protein
LAQVFYGDYPAAVDVMRVYSASEIFAQPSLLISGTVAAGWEGTLSDWITTTTTPAIEVNPQLAAAYFVRGWGEWAGGAAAAAEAAGAAAGDTPPDGETDAETSAAAGPAIDEASLAAAVADIRQALALSPDPAQAAYFAEALTFLTGEEVSVPDGQEVTSTEGITGTAAVTGTGTITGTIMGTNGATGRLLYSTVQDGQDRIYLLAFGAANATLTEVLGQARQPALQPGGVRLAFQSTQADMLGLGGYDLSAGSDPQAAGRFNFTTNLEDSLPRWNPEGNRLAFSSTRYGDGRTRVYTVWADTTSEAIDLGEGSDPDWSPDGARLVYRGCDESGANCGLWTMAVDGTDRRQLTDNGGDARPRWTPGGERVVFMSDQREEANFDVYSVAVNPDYSGGEVVRITLNAASDGLPAVSPDGSEIVFVSNRGNQWGIWRVAIDSGRAQSVVGDLGALTNWLEQAVDWVR